MKTLMFVVWFGGFGADTASTQYALGQGAHEAVLSQKPWANHVMIAGAAGGGAYGLQRLSKEHPKLAVTLGIAVGVLRAGVAAHNMSVARQMRKH